MAIKEEEEKHYYETIRFLHLGIYSQHLVAQNYYSALLTSAGICPTGFCLFSLPPPPIQIALRLAIMFNVPFATAD